MKGILAFVLPLLVLFLTMAARCQAQTPAGNAAKNCPMSYNHEPPNREDPSAVSGRLRRGENLGSYSSNRIAGEIPLPDQFLECVKEQGEADSAAGEPQDIAAVTFECMVGFAGLFRQELQSVSSNVPNQQAAKDAYYAVFQHWGAIVGVRGPSVAEECGLIASQELGLDSATSLSIEALTVFASPIVDPALQRAYWGALRLDVRDQRAVSCRDGCNRLFWLKAIFNAH
jgi:hypothetical protein